MCAVCMEGYDVQVGCDVEMERELRLKLAERRFCREEYETIIAEQDKDKRIGLFYRYWVLKESFMKATGKGMALSTDQFCIRLGDPPVPDPEACRIPETILLPGISPGRPAVQDGRMQFGLQDR